MRQRVVACGFGACTLFELDYECIPLHDGCLHSLLLRGGSALQLLDIFFGGTENRSQCARWRGMVGMGENAKREGSTHANKR